MRSLFYVLTSLAVIALAFWAYDENYRTKAAIERAEDLQRDIARARSRLKMLHAEWAYLNRPDRLRELVLINYGKLELLPMRPEQFGSVTEVAFPPAAPPEFELQGTVTLSSYAGEEP